ncbi:MAG: ATP-binding protein, partial [Chloroflexota bacterium]
IQQLQNALSLLDETLNAAVSQARQTGHNPADAFNGLTITDTEVERHLTLGTLPGLWVDRTPWSLPSLEGCDRLSWLLRSFDLTEIDGYLLLLAAAPELDRRYERLYGFLQDDVTQRYLTVNLAINLLGNNRDERFAVWERLMPSSPLIKQFMLSSVGDTGRVGQSMLSRVLKIDLRVLNHLLGQDTLDDRLKQAAQIACAGRLHLGDAVLDPIRRMLPESPVVYLTGLPDTGRRETAAALCAEIDLPLMTVDAAALATLEMSPEFAWRLALREGQIRGAALLIHEWDTLPAMVWDLAQNYPLPLFLCGAGGWEPNTAERSRRMLRLHFEPPSVAVRSEVWSAALPEADASVIDEVSRKFRMTSIQITRAAATALDLAASRGDTLTGADVYAGVQQHSSARLGDLARRITLRYNWDDLVLPADQMSQLREMSARARFTDLVHEDWGYGRKIAPYRGVSALFSGESGTGKTLAAQVLAADLGLAIYQIDLSSVVSKYIGETEKNLSTIFEEAQLTNALLFFDEADALFGKRSEVKDAHDRYANIETAYLLQRIESYDGVAVMATNLKQNLDEAFTRRFDFMIDFPFPDADSRHLIWRAHFPPQAPLAPEVDLMILAEGYRLAGGNIRNVALRSAYLAAADGEMISLKHVRQAVRREQQKMGRLLNE